MTIYRRKPTTADAMQWTGDNIHDLWEWGGAAGIYGPTEKNPDQLLLTTVHGERAVCRVGDWVVREPVSDRFYPCKPDIFAANYELADGEASS
jgi:hypothetical protein